MSDIRIYNYAENVKNPTEMGMYFGDSMSALQRDMDGIGAYIDVLTRNKYGGDMNAAKSYQGKGGPMGNRYIINTGGKCETSKGEKVDRYKVIDNLPSTELGKYRGLVPGMAGNITKLNPLPIVKAFIEPAVPPCTNVKLRLFKRDNTIETKSAYISNDDIEDLSPCAFVGFKNPITGKTPSLGGKEQVYKDSAAACRNEFEEFTVMLNGDENDKTPGGFSMNTGGGIPNDLLTNIYILSLGLFGIYIVKKVTEK